MQGHGLKQWMGRIVMGGLAAVVLLASALFPAAPQAAAAPQAPAAEPWVVRVAGACGGGMFSVDSNLGSGLAYVGRGRRLEVYDAAFSDPPELLGQSDILPDVALDVDVVGEYAYVANGAGGLRVFDVTDYSQPVEVAAAALPGEAIKVVVANERAYVATHTHLYVVNVANPTQPTVAGQLMLTHEGIQGLAADGGMAYLTGGNTLFLVDASNPTAPDVVKTVTLLGDGRGVAVQGGYAYVTSREHNLQVVDVAPADSAKAVASLAVSQYSDAVSVQGNFAFVGSSNSGGVQVIDITDPTQPEKVTYFPGTPLANFIKAVGTRLYTAGLEAGLGVVNISVPYSPTLLATRKADNVLHVEVGQTLAGKTALLSNRTAGFKAIGVDDPAALEEFDTFDSVPALAAVQVGDLAYTANGGGGLRTLEVSQPESINSLSSLSTGDFAHALAIKGEYAYVANGTSGLFIAKLTDPLTKTGSVDDTPGGAFSVAVTGTHAYLAYGVLDKGGLQVINVSNPVSPSTVVTLSLDSVAYGVAVQGQYAYVATKSRGLVVVDISNPLAPAEKGAYDTDGKAQSVTLHGNLALVAGTNGVTAVDVSDPAHPVLAGHFDTYNANAIKVYGNHIYVADGLGGLLILEPVSRLFLPVVRR